ncbi:MAG: family 43 glycosylhydrolase [Clostridia bacterium]|nr:family 43 glycosylhydrolase [Clostridia bacterium]
MNADNYLRTPWNTPFIAQRADPCVRRISGKWYFTASVPSYNGIAVRCADTLEGLRDAEEKMIWHAHESGVMSRHIWAPELHFLDGCWYIYFAAGEKDDCWKIRPWVLRCKDADPVNGAWEECGMLRRAEGDQFSFTAFSLDMTVFEHGGKRYCIWAEKVSTGPMISNLYIAEMATPLSLKTPQMLLSSPSYAWERHGFWVNEGPAVLEHEGRIYVTFSGSDTSAAYCMGLIWMEGQDDPMDISAWHKVNHPVFVTNREKGIFGPGHNTFFRDEEGRIYTSYHARPYDEIVGDPLYDPNRHAFVMEVPFKDGMPVFSLDHQLFQP